MKGGAGRLRWGVACAAPSPYQSIPQPGSLCLCPRVRRSDLALPACFPNWCFPLIPHPPSPPNRAQPPHPSAATHLDADGVQLDDLPEVDRDKQLLVTV